MPGKNDAIMSPTFCDTANPVTRIRMGNCSWKNVANVAFHIWKKIPCTITMHTKTSGRLLWSIAHKYPPANRPQRSRQPP